MNGNGEAPPAALTRRLTTSDDFGALRLLRGLGDEGMTSEQLLLDVIAPAQAEIGGMWQADCLSVAQEHAASCICEWLITRVSGATDTPPVHLGTVVVACAEREWHSLPARLVAEIVRLHGWRVHFLGANVPSAHLAAYIAAYRPMTTLLSASLGSRLPQVHQAVRASQQDGVPVIVGGAAFGPAGQRAGQVGADAWAPDARQVVEVLADGAYASQVPASPNRPYEDEYAAIAADQWMLLRQVMKTLTQAPHLRAHLMIRINDVVTAIDYLIEHLTGAVYADDDTVFTDYVRWLVNYLAACQGPLETVDIALAVLAKALPHRPRAQQALRAGTDVPAAFRLD